MERIKKAPIKRFSSASFHLGNKYKVWAKKEMNKIKGMKLGISCGPMIGVECVRACACMRANVEWRNMHKSLLVLESRNFNNKESFTVNWMGCLSIYRCHCWCKDQIESSRMREEWQTKQQESEKVCEGGSETAPDEIERSDLCLYGRSLLWCVIPWSCNRRMKRNGKIA